METPQKFMFWVLLVVVISLTGCKQQTAIEQWNAHIDTVLEICERNAPNAEQAAAELWEYNSTHRATITQWQNGLVNDPPDPTEVRKTIFKFKARVEALKRRHPIYVTQLGSLLEHP